MARLSPSRHALHRGIRLLNLRKGDDSPLSTVFPRVLRATCATRQLSTPRRRRSEHSATYQTLSRQCAATSSSLSRGTCRDAHAAPPHAKKSCQNFAYDAVRLGNLHSRTNQSRRRMFMPFGASVRLSPLGVAVMWVTKPFWFCVAVALRRNRSSGARDGRSDAAHGGEPRTRSYRHSGDSSERSLFKVPNARGTLDGAASPDRRAMRADGCRSGWFGNRAPRAHEMTAPKPICWIPEARTKLDRFLFRCRAARTEQIWAVR
jgi:hypothetical protein